MCYPSNADILKKIITVFYIAFFLAISFATYQYFKPTKNIANQKTDIQLTGKQLLKDFNINHTNAEIKYKNKVVELYGAIKTAEVKDSICSVVFDDGGNFIIVANFVYSEKRDVEKLIEGDFITIKGIYSGFIVNDDTFMIPAEIKIDKCTLLK